MLGKIAFCLIVCAVSAPVFSLVLTRNSSGDTYEPIPTCPPNDTEKLTFFPAINCSKFWECSNGKPFIVACPTSLEFNPVLDVCTEPDSSNCTGQGWSTTIKPTTSTSTTTTSTTTTSTTTTSTTTTSTTTTSTTTTSTTTPVPTITFTSTSTTVGPTWWTTWFDNDAIQIE